MQVYRSGLVKLVLDESLGEMVYDNEYNNYDKSYIHSYIKDENNLKLDSDKLETMDICLDVVDDASNITCENKFTDYVSILSITDYGNSVNTETNKSYINNTKNIWLISKNSEDFAWNITNGMLTQDNISFEYSVKPVITLKNNAHSETGVGTKENPYVVKDGE